MWRAAVSANGKKNMAAGRMQSSFKSFYCSALLMAVPSNGEIVSSNNYKNNSILNNYQYNNLIKTFACS